MVHLFCGFPRALDALGAAAVSLGLAPAASPDDPAAFASRGRALFDRVYGDDAERVHARLTSLDPELTAWVLTGRPPPPPLPPAPPPAIASAAFLSRLSSACRSWFS